MKPTLLITILFFLSLIGKGQTKQAPLRFLRSTEPIKVSFYIDSTGDTIHITKDSHLRFIKIDDEVYEIVRHPATIEKVQPAFMDGIPIGGDSTYRLWDPRVFHSYNGVIGL